VFPPYDHSLILDCVITPFAEERINLRIAHCDEVIKTERSYVAIVSFYVARSAGRASSRTNSSIPSSRTSIRSSPRTARSSGVWRLSRRRSGAASGRSS
jgi:hypothetical protein